MDGGMLQKIRVLIADDHELVRAGVRTVLMAEDGLDVVGEAADGGQAVEMARRTRPDVILMDVRMPLMSGHEATAFIKREMPTTHILMLTAASDVESIVRSFDVGANGYLVKDVLPEELVMAVKSIGVGERILSATAQRSVEEANGSGAATTDGLPLTKRERQVVALVSSGFTSQQIAEHLEISRRTVETHRARIMAKLGVNNAAGLVRLSMTNTPAAPITANQHATDT
ncbi:MAG: response regulator transcription factor [Candidatus Kapabacteria bacterium]|nr:response regulator transcription factor [Candidatus Kapabacteria bacterium]